MNKEELKKELAARLTSYNWAGLHEAATALAKETQEAPEDVELSDLRTITSEYRLELFQRVKARRPLPQGWARDLYVALGRSLVAHPGGRPRSSKASRVLTVALSLELSDRVDATCGSTGKSKRKIVEEALTSYFEKKE